MVVFSLRERNLGAKVNNVSLLILSRRSRGRNMRSTLRNITLLRLHNIVPHSKTLDMRLFLLFKLLDLLIQYLRNYDGVTGCFPMLFVNEHLLLWTSIQCISVALYVVLGELVRVEGALCPVFARPVILLVVARVYLVALQVTQEGDLV
jgi:hypothetical protein